VGNYLSNAVKYAKTKIAVTVQKTAEDVLIVVRDDGPGIQPDKISQVFESYYMVSGGKPGIGIGLASVRMIADLHKGKAWVESSQEKGSEFSFLLPGRRSSMDQR
jgi:signal transduction histidine kinase